MSNALTGKQFPYFNQGFWSWTTNRKRLRTINAKLLIAKNQSNMRVMPIEFFQMRRGYLHRRMNSLPSRSSSSWPTTTSDKNNMNAYMIGIDIELFFLLIFYSHHRHRLRHECEWSAWEQCCFPLPTRKHLLSLRDRRRGKKKIEFHLSLFLARAR